MSEERRRLRQGGREPPRRRPGARRRRRPAPTSSWSTRAPSSRPPARSRSTPSSPWATPGRTGSRLVVTGCMAERYGDELAEALPEVDAVVGFEGEGVALGDSVAARAAQGQARRRARPARAAPPRAERAVGVPEGGRGLRPRLRVLRHPVVPRQAALPHARVDRGRGPQPGRGRRRRARARRAGPRLVRARRRRARFARAAAPPARHARGRRPRARPPPLPLPERGARPARVHHARAADGRALLRPLAAARRRAAAAAHEAMGERRPLPHRHRRHPRRRSPTPRSARRSSSASPARPSASTTSCSRSSRPRRSTGPASSRSRPRTARPRRRCPTRSTPTSRSSGCASARRCRSPSRAPRATRWSAGRSRCSSTRRRRRQASSSVARTAKHPRSTAIVRLHAEFARPGALVRAHVTEAIGPDLVAKALVTKAAREHAAGHARPSLRRRRHRHPGQHRHHRPARPRGPHAAADHRPGLELAHRLALVRAHHHRRARRLARPPRRHHPLRRVPRSAGRQVPRARRVLRARHQRRLLVGRGAHRDRARGRRLDVPLVRGPARHLAAGPPAREVEGVLPVPRGRRRAAAAHLRVGDVPRHPPVVRGRAVGRLGPRHRDQRPARRSERAGQRRVRRMRCDVLAIGTELLLGQIVDTNSSWIGEQLAAAGHRHVRAPQGGRQPRPHGAVPARAARPRRRGDRVRWASAPRPTTSPAKRSPR